MKNIFIVLIMLIVSLSGFAQSFSVDSKSMSVPRYANQTAITAAITAPTDGMLVFNIALDQFAYYNGTAWVNFPTASSGPVLWSVNGANRIAANGGYPAGIEVNKITSLSNNNTLANALINAEGNGTTFLKFGISGGNWSISQDAVTGFTLGSSGINWRYNDNASPQGTTHMFGYSANTFNITGALNATGNATIGGTSGLRGKTTIGTTTTSGNGLEIQSSFSNSAAPDIYIKSPNNVIRYGNVTGNAGMMQSIINSATPGSASMAFVHLDNATPPTQTVMMSLDGEGDMTAFGFTKLGGSGADVPAIKTKYFTGTMTTTNGGWPAVGYDIAHGLNFSKIIEMSVLVTGLSNITVGENSTIAGYQYSAFFENSNIRIIRGASSASITPAAGLNVAFKILVTYIP